MTIDNKLYCNDFCRHALQRPRHALQCPKHALQQPKHAWQHPWPTLACFCKVLGVPHRRETLLLAAL